MRNLVFEFKVAVLSENIYIIINNSILSQSLDKPQMSSYKLFLTLDEICIFSKRIPFCKILFMLILTFRIKFHYGRPAIHDESSWFTVHFRPILIHSGLRNALKPFSKPDNFDSPNVWPEGSLQPSPVVENTHHLYRAKAFRTFRGFWCE